MPENAKLLTTSCWDTLQQNKHSFGEGVHEKKIFLRMLEGLDKLREEGHCSCSKMAALRRGEIDAPTMEKK